MKKVLVLAGVVVLVSATGLFAAPQQSTNRKPAPAPAARQAKPPAASTMAHPRAGEFVSYNTTTKMLTVKDAKGQTSTAVLEGKAIGEVGTFKPGDWLMLTWRDAKGQHVAVTNIVKGTRPA
jgi:hypothetical protein